jgi:hypothetical protein
MSETLGRWGSGYYFLVGELLPRSYSKNLPMCLHAHPLVPGFPFENQVIP